MATINGTLKSLADSYKENLDTKKAGTIIELLGKYTSLVEDAPAMECNLATFHRSLHRVALPSTQWGILNTGVANSKARSRQVDDTTGMLQARSAIDVNLLKIQPDKARFRFNEMRAFMQALAQDAESALWYANSNIVKEQILGFAPRYNSTTAAVGSQLVDAGGSGSDNTSIWFVIWDELASHLIFPKGLPGGLEHQDLGEGDEMDENGRPFRAMRDLYQWQLGLANVDYRTTARIHSIDVSDLTRNAATGANLIDMMVDVWHTLQAKGLPSGALKIYGNSTVLKFLDHQSRQGNANILMSVKEWGPNSEPMMTFRGSPIRRSDALLNTEAAV
jgi:hypothetical protein